MKRFAFLTAALFLVGINIAHAETITVKPTGEYATIDTKPTQKIMAQLQKGTQEERTAAIEELRDHPDKYAPPALCVLSAELVERGEMDEAAFWFYAGQLRSRADGQLCKDITARDGTNVLTMQFGTPVNQYMFKHIDVLKQLVPKVVEWDRVAAHNYDRRWIALHGMGSFGFESSKKKDSVIEPKSKWAESDEVVRTKYLQNFNEAMAQLPSQSPAEAPSKNPSEP